MQNKPKKPTAQHEIDNDYAMENVIPFWLCLVSLFKTFFGHTSLPKPLRDPFDPPQLPKAFLGMLFGIDFQ